MTRRTALTLAATASTSAANSAVNIGLLGAGNRGPYVAGLLAKHTPGKVAALCDLSEERMAKAQASIGAGGARLYTDFRQMLASDLDAIIIATPVFLHAEHFEAALKAGKHIYLEKPASMDVAGCKRIMALADAADRKLNLTFGFQRRYAELYRKGKQLADSGVVGAIRLGHAKFIKSEGTRERPTARPQTAREKIEQWGAWKDLSGDLIVENNVHSIDVLNWFLGGRPASAIGAGGTTARTKGDMRDHNFVAFEYASGVQGQLTGTTLAPPGYRDVSEQFFGEKGLIETSENFLRHFKGPGQETLEKTPRNITIDAVSEFVKRIAEGQPENTIVRGAESTLTAILGRMAMDARREVTWAEMMKSA